MIIIIIFPLNPYIFSFDENNNQPLTRETNESRK